MSAFHDIPRDAIEAQQLKKLRELIGFCLEHPGFYTDKLKQAGLDSSIASLDEFKSKMPFTTKQDLIQDQTLNPPYGTTSFLDLDAYCRFCQTSGSTGEPLRWLDTPQSWQWMVDCWKEVYIASGVSYKDRILFPFSFGPFIGFWLAFESAMQMGCLCLTGGGITSSARLKLIQDHQATVLCCTPTYALRLAELAQQEGIDPGKTSIQKLIVAGEPGASIPATREKIETAWQATVYDHHGMTEVGPVTYECPENRGVLRVIEPEYLAEVIEPESLRNVEVGETGELVLTTLGRLGSPLFRYRTGDIVKLVDNQSLGCKTHRMGFEGGIIGRTDDMVFVRGVNLYPAAIESVVRQFKDIVEYQVELQQNRNMSELLISVEIDQNHDRPEQIVDELAAKLQKTFLLRIPVQLVSSGSLPRYEMKAKRWIKIDKEI